MHDRTNNGSLEPMKTLAENDKHLRGAHEQKAAQIPPSQTLFETSRWEKSDLRGRNPTLINDEPGNGLFDEGKV